MKRISFILLIFVTTISFSQNNLDEVVYLKNGSVIRGLIIEQIPNQTLKIQTKDGSVFVYNFSEVQKITKEAPYKNPSINQPIQILEKPVLDNQVINQNNIETRDTIDSAPKNSYTYNSPAEKKGYLKKGFIGVTEIGSLFAAGRNNAAFSFNQLLGKRTSQMFSIGMAFGADINKFVLYVPVTLDTRIYFIKKRITPFLNLALGYAMLLANYKYNSSEIFHTFITNFGLGVEFKINKGLGLSLNAGGRLTYFPKQNIDDVGGSGFVKFGIVY